MDAIHLVEPAERHRQREGAEIFEPALLPHRAEAAGADGDVLTPDPGAFDVAKDVSVQRVAMARAGVRRGTRLRQDDGARVHGWCGRSWV